MLSPGGGDSRRRRSPPRRTWRCAWPRLRGESIVHRPAPLPFPKDGGQLIILSGFIATIALITVTLMLNDVIYAGNSASIETLQPTKFEFGDALKQVKKEVVFARQINPTTSDFTKHMESFTWNISKLFAARGVAVEVNWSGVTSSSSVISVGAAIAYCGDKNKDSEFNLWSWMRDLGLNVTDYTHDLKCEKLEDGGTWRRPSLLFEQLCRGGTATENRLCWDTGPPVRNYDAVVFEFHKLRPKENNTAPLEVCQGHSGNADDGILNHSNCLALMNFTAMGGIVIVTSKEPNTALNQTLVDVLTQRFNGYSIGGATTSVLRTSGVDEDDGRITNLTPLLKNYQIGDEVEFSGNGFIFPWVSGLQIYICHKDDYSAGTPNCAGSQRGIAVSWCYKTAVCASASDHNVFYFPHLKGELERLGDEILDGNLQPLFNLLPPGGSCAVIFKARDGTTTYNATINC